MSGGEMEAYVARALEALAEEIGEAEPIETIVRGDYSNDLAEVHYNDGRRLIVKRARYPEADERFATSRLASELLREAGAVEAPHYLGLPRDVGDRPGLAYWRIDRPTLERLWPALDEAARTEALRSWGVLQRRIHESRVPGHGPLPTASREATELGEFLAADLEDRLGPAVAESWPAGATAVELLRAAVPEVAARAGGEGGVLVHNDLWYANLLCDTLEGAARCVGVLDLEDAFAGPPEADLAKTAVVHGPLFGQPLAGRWLEPLLEGYAAPLDPLALAFFRAYHLVNMGYHAALTGHAAHAQDVARAAEEHARSLDHPPDARSA